MAEPAAGGRGATMAEPAAGVAATTGTAGAEATVMDDSADPRDGPRRFASYKQRRAWLRKQKRKGRGVQIDDCMTTVGGGAGKEDHGSAHSAGPDLPGPAYGDESGGGDRDGDGHGGHSAMRPDGGAGDGPGPTADSAAGGAATYSDDDEVLDSAIGSGGAGGGAGGQLLELAMARLAAKQRANGLAKGLKQQLAGYAGMAELNGKSSMHRAPHSSAEEAKSGASPVQETARTCCCAHGMQFLCRLHGPRGSSAQHALTAEKNGKSSLEERTAQSDAPA